VPHHTHARAVVMRRKNDKQHETLAAINDTVSLSYELNTAAKRFAIKVEGLPTIALVPPDAQELLHSNYDGEAFPRSTQA
jgi:hypothetical protein